MKNLPSRMCVCCRQMKPQRELLRIVKNKEDKVFVDKTGKAQGRGAYICLSKECFLKAKKTKAFERTFKVGIDESLYSEIEKEISNE